MRKPLLSVKLNLYRSLARTQTRCLAALFNMAVDSETKERDNFSTVHTISRVQGKACCGQLQPRGLCDGGRWLGSEHALISKNSSGTNGCNQHQLRQTGANARPQVDAHHFGNDMRFWDSASPFS